jgi:hypothetical protein
MFDSKAEIGLTIQGEPPKKIVVRVPTDSEFIAWRRKKKVVQKDLGRRKFQMEQSKPEPCDLALVSAIRVDKDGPSIDEAEAIHIIGRLTECDVPNRPDREGSAYVIAMKVMRRLATSHTLRIPSVKEQMDYERMRSSVIFGQYGQQEIRINFQAAAELYDKLKVSVDGYANDVPVFHKAEAVNVLLQELREEQEESPDEDDEDLD